LLLKGGTVLDPAQDLARSIRVAVQDGKIAGRGQLGRRDLQRVPAAYLAEVRD
jgi:hypothetical protein